MSYRAGFLGLIGQPNAGKSSLMNYLVEEKVSIVSSKPQTTRRRVLGIWSSEEGQIVFVDAPGVVKSDKGLNSFLMKEAEDVIKESDALVAVLSIDESKAESAEEIIEMVSKSRKPWIGVITKADLQDKSHRVLILKNLIESKGGKSLTISVKEKSKESQEDRKAILNDFLNLLPESPSPLYDIDLFTPETERTLVAEIVREKCFELLHEEVPFGIAIRVLKFELPKIHLEIIVTKENHKGIVIGKGGSQLKQIGIEARKDIEKLLGGQVYLDLKVNFKEDWGKNKGIMKDLGYVKERKN